MPIGDNLVKRKFIKQDLLKGEGSIFRVTAEPELVEATDPKYGFKKGANQGKTIRYAFEMLENGGVVKCAKDTISSRFLQVLNASGAEVGDFVRLAVTGSGLDTTYMATKVDKPDTWPQ